MVSSSHTFLVPIFVLPLLCSTVLAYIDDSSLVYATKGGTFRTRVLCALVLECTSEATNIYWSFSGVANPLPEVNSRFTNSSVYVITEDKKVIVSSLVLSPVLRDYETSYSCNVEDISSSSVSFTVEVKENIIDVPVIPNVNLSNHRVGERLSVEIVIETCLMEFFLSIYKDQQRVFNVLVSDNHQSSTSIWFPLTVDDMTMGQYGVRVSSSEASTPLTYFNMTGSPMPPLLQ